MSRLSASGAYAVVGSGFIAQGDTNQSDGLGPRYTVGEFTDAQEAVAAVQHKGVQGDPGYVLAFEDRLYEGGTLQRHTREVYGRRRDSRGWYTVGWTDLRDEPGVVRDVPKEGRLLAPPAEGHHNIVDRRMLDAAVMLLDDSRFGGQAEGAQRWSRRRVRLREAVSRIPGRDVAGIGRQWKWRSICCVMRAPT